MDVGGSAWEPARFQQVEGFESQQGSQKAGEWLGGKALTLYGRAVAFIPMLQRKQEEKKEGGGRPCLRPAE